MAFIPTVNAVKVTIIGSIGGQQVVIDITIGKGSAFSLSDLSDVADAIEDWYGAEMNPEVCNEYTQEEIKVYDLSSSTAPVFNKAIAFTGGGAFTPVKANVALVTSFLTANRGRSGRGRNYLAGLRDSVGTPVATDGATAAAVALAWSELNTYLTPLGMEHIVISNYTGGAPRAAGLKQPVTSYRTNVDYDSQRRRLAGRGA